MLRKLYSLQNDLYLPVPFSRIARLKLGQSGSQSFSKPSDYDFKAVRYSVNKAPTVSTSRDITYGFLLLCSASVPRYYWITAADWRHNGKSIAEQQCGASRTGLPGFHDPCNPTTQMLDKHRDLDLGGYNQEDARGASLAQPEGDQLHQLNCSHPWRDHRNSGCRAFKKYILNIPNKYTEKRLIVLMHLSCGAVIIILLIPVLFWCVSVIT